MKPRLFQNTSRFGVLPARLLKDVSLFSILPAPPAQNDACSFSILPPRLKIIFHLSLFRQPACLKGCFMLHHSATLPVPFQKGSCMLCHPAFPKRCFSIVNPACSRIRPVSVVCQPGCKRMLQVSAFCHHGSSN